MKKFNINKKALNIAVDVIVGIILILVILVTANIIASADKPYTSVFGKIALAVKTDSMKGGIKDVEGFGDAPAQNGFAKGDLVLSKELTKEEVLKLKVGDVITFRDISLGGELNTHRIIKIQYVDNEQTIVAGFRTKGDNEPNEDRLLVDVDSVVGVYSDTLKGVGNFSLFLHSQTGFLVLIVIPAFLILAYCVATLIISLKKKGKEDTEKQIADEKEKLRAELLAEMNAQKDEEPKEEPAQEEPEAPVDSETKE